MKTREKKKGTVWTMGNSHWTGIFSVPYSSICSVHI